MANALYDSGRNAFLTAGINWLTDTIKVALVDGNYVPSLGADQFWSAAAPHVVGTPVQLASPTAVAGLAGAAAATFPGLTGNQANFIVIYKDTGDPTTSLLIACIDTAPLLPVVPAGQDVTITWDPIFGGIFKL